MSDDVVPVMQIGDTLLVALQGDLDDTTVIQIEEQLTREVARTGATGMLVDVSRLSVVDSFIARVLARIVADGVRTSRLPLAGLLAPGLAAFDPAHPPAPENFRLAASAAHSDERPAGS